MADNLPSVSSSLYKYFLSYVYCFVLFSVLHFSEFGTCFSDVVIYYLQQNTIQYNMI